MNTSAFWQETLERAIKTFAQVLLAVLSTGSFGLLDAPWLTGLSLAAMAAVLSVLASVASEPFGRRGTPSAVAPAERPVGVDPPA
jgi:hypothetical protein